MKKTKKMSGGGFAGGLAGVAQADGDLRGAVPGLMGAVMRAKMAREAAGANPTYTPGVQSPELKTPTTNKMAKGGRVRGDGCCQRGKTKGMMR